jgi:ABC-type Co2+ transport system permease subunit
MERFHEFWAFIQPIGDYAVTLTSTKVDDHLWAAVKALAAEGWLTGIFNAAELHLETGVATQVKLPEGAQAMLASQAVSLGEIVALVTTLVSLWRQFRGGR